MSTEQVECPCCNYLTLTERAAYEICPVCFWEDDGQDDPQADEVWGGPNGTLSLTAARRSFARIGACEERVLAHVRGPRLEEIPAQVVAGHGALLDASGWSVSLVGPPPRPVEPLVVVGFVGMALVWTADEPGWWMGARDDSNHSIVCWGNYGCDLAEAIASL